ncbi:probable methyltransferase BMT2 homolog isoform X2 [Octopus vulgaris]|uniref:S-adenosylmethionine sensor upstream of mTORC1 n=1 Tax=Octopus vulgaris TaxID=6645 RepID=A0AA36AVW7_OCTVU|nr:probable methyltransferase BMT2 homolog isoform X2 [Octopus vulgaris]
MSSSSPSCESSMSTDDKKQQHLRLAGVVKSVHADLRKKYRETGGDFQKIWEEHCKNGQLLTDYADAMHHLAVDHWSYLPQTRITWCRDIIHKFFLQDGLQKARDKDMRRLRHHQTEQNSPLEGCVEKTSSASGSLVASGSVCRPEDYRNQKQNIVMLDSLGKIRLLDVGSCFNPFLQFEEFLAVGIDISPAKSSVYRCDFLHLETQEPLQVAPDTLETLLNNLKSPVQKLPQCSFHVVVFSLLLEYFPSPYQRWLCCLKAHKLLMIDGLLLIVSPDSHQQHRNAHMMKSWKKAIEAMGFSRWHYTKLEHLHCMAFRKLYNMQDEISLIAGDIYPDMMYIPQDSNDRESDFQDNLIQSIFDVDNKEFFERTRSELPNEFSDEEDSP